MFDIHRYAPHMLPKVRSDAIMHAPKHNGGMPCTLRICSLVPGYSCSPPNTVVMNHLPIWGKGMSTKTTDMAAVAGCFRCHEILDARDIRRTDYLIQHAPSLLAERMTHAITETHALLIERGIIQVPDAEML